MWRCGLLVDNILGLSVGILFDQKTQTRFNSYFKFDISVNFLFTFSFIHAN